MADFDKKEIAWLNQAHGTPLKGASLTQVYELLGGQPYLLRKLFYELVKEGQSFSDVYKDADKDQGPFGDHLRRNLWQLKDKKELATAFTQIIKHGRGDDDKALIRLSKAGLIQQTANGYMPRCNLYSDYYGEKL